MSFPLSLDALLTRLSQDQIRAKFVQLLVDMNVPADKWRQGGVFSSILTIVAATYSGFQNVMVAATAAGFLPYASGPWLVLLAYYVYGVTARPASFATGPLTLVNSLGGIYSYGPNQATFLNSTTGKTYTNESAFTLGAVSTTVPPIIVVATEAGGASTAAPGEINQLVTAMLGVSCSNPASVVGLDAQSDADLRAVCLAKLGSFSVRGPRSAYKYAISIATRATDGTPVNVNRSTISANSHTGVVTVTIASASGTPDLIDLAGVQASIEASALPVPVTLVLRAATPVDYSPTLTVWAQPLPGVTEDGIRAAVGGAISTLIQSYPIGGLVTDSARGLFASNVTGVAQGSHPAIVDVLGAIDLPLTDGQVAVAAIAPSQIIVRFSPVEPED